MARPFKDIDYDRVERLASIQATEAEIAVKVGLTPEGFSKRKGKDPKLVQALEGGRTDDI
jgi:hypothetical protein